MACLAAAVHVTVGRGIGGRETAVQAVRQAFTGLGFEPLGTPVTSLEGDQAVAWALARVRSGSELVVGDGAAMRWRVRFPGGGEGATTVSGAVWALRRPVPADPGPNLYLATVQRAMRERVAAVLPDAEQWQWVAGQSWREGDVTWHRARFLFTAKGLPQGWQGHIEVEMAGSSVISLHRRTEPLGSDVGVVMGRIAELELLRLVGVLGLGLGLVGVTLAGAEQVAFRRRVRLLGGVAAGSLAWTAGIAGALPPWECALGAVLAGAVIGLLPAPATAAAGRRLIAAPAGVLVAVALLALPGVVEHLGGWLPPRSPLLAEGGPAMLAGRMWFPALTEEPMLRFALPMLLAPLAGWWGGALVGAALGCLLHPVPAVPLTASLAAELALNVAMAAVARWGGLTSAILARGVCEGLLRRPSLPAGPAADAVVVAAVAVAFLAGVGRRRKGAQ